MRPASWMRCCGSAEEQTDDSPSDPATPLKQQGSRHMATDQAPIASDTAPPATTLALQGVYLKDCSFESPLGPRGNGEWNPQISLDLNTTVQPVAGDLREVVLTVTVSAKQAEQTLFLVEVKQAGAFVMQNLSTEDYKRAIGSICPSVLFPYARAVVSQLVSQGGFPQLLLPPVNFDALYASSLNEGANATKN
jgi:preprotein translocase subunit SecB